MNVSGHIQTKNLAVHSLAQTASTIMQFPHPLSLLYRCMVCIPYTHGTYMYMYVQLHPYVLTSTVQCGFNISSVLKNLPIYQMTFPTNISSYTVCTCTVSLAHQAGKVTREITSVQQILCVHSNIMLPGNFVTCNTVCIQIQIVDWCVN